MKWIDEETNLAGEGTPTGNEPEANNPAEGGGEGGGNGGSETETTTTTPSTEKTEERRPRRRGFAAMDRDRVKEIASKGGKAAHAAGTAHQFTSDEARVAGRKGGMAPHARRGGVRRRPVEGGASANNAQQGQSVESGRGENR
jgi:general stress protein YciG